MTNTFRLGAVAYDPKVVTIWDGFRKWFLSQDFPFDYVLYSNYERQVDDLVSGRINVAWNSPLAWVRSRRINPEARALAMRDTDRDLKSVIAVGCDSDIATIADLAGRVVAAAAVDSPQGTLLPLALLGGIDIVVKRFEAGVGLHGDHIGGERDAALAMAAGDVNAACMLDENLLQFAIDGTLPRGGTRVIAQTPVFDHCNMTAIGSESPLLHDFCTLLFGMDYADPTVRTLFDLEGLTKWLPGRVTGYDQLESAVDALRFYDGEGKIIANGYRV